MVEREKKLNMHDMKFIFAVFLVSCSLTLTVSGCGEKTAKPGKSGSSVLQVQGTWTGYEAGGAPGTWTFVFSPDHGCQVTGPSPQEWYRGTCTLDSDADPPEFTVFIEDCPYPSCKGETAFGIYKLEDSTLTIAGTTSTHARFSKSRRLTPRSAT